MSKAWTQIFLYPIHIEMSICAINTTLLTDGEDDIAKQTETITDSIKQCIAFQGERDHIYLKSLNMNYKNQCFSFFFLLLCIFPTYKEAANVNWIRSMFPSSISPCSLNPHVITSVELIAMVSHGLNIIKERMVQTTSNLFIDSN